MESEAFLLNNTGEINTSNERDAGGESNPWLEMAEEVRSSREGEVEVPEKDSYTFDGVEYRNVDKINILDNEGKCKWLGGILENGVLNTKTELEEAMHYGDSSEVNGLYAKLNDLLNSDGAAQKDIDETFKNYSATFNLLGLLESETARRDPNYFSPDGMRNILANKIEQAE